MENFHPILSQKDEEHFSLYYSHIFAFKLTEQVRESVNLLLPSI